MQLLQHTAPNVPPLALVDFVAIDESKPGYCGLPDTRLRSCDFCGGNVISFGWRGFVPAVDLYEVLDGSVLIVCGACLEGGEIEW